MLSLSNKLSPFQKNIHRLPNEIQHIILSYTYSPQSKNLLEDIVNYSETKEYLYQLIEEVEAQANYYFTSAKDEIHNEICNFIYYYLCDGTIQMVHIYFWRRYFMHGIYNSHDISNYIIDKLSNYSIDYQINFIWGLLVPEERYAFLDYYINDFESDGDEAVEEDYDF
jgi:hypothetical protein